MRTGRKAIPAVAPWADADWAALTAERAAIREYDGGLDRPAAEAAAQAEVDALRRRGEQGRLL